MKTPIHNQKDALPTSCARHHGTAFRIPWSMPWGFKAVLAPQRDLHNVRQMAFNDMTDCSIYQSCSVGARQVGIACPVKSTIKYRHHKCLSSLFCIHPLNYCHLVVAICLIFPPLASNSTRICWASRFYGCSPLTVAWIGRDERSAASSGYLYTHIVDKHVFFNGWLMGD